MTYKVDVRFAHGISYHFILPEEDMVRVREWMKDPDHPVLVVSSYDNDYYLNREFFCSGHIGVKK